MKKQNPKKPSNLCQGKGESVVARISKKAKEIRKKNEPWTKAIQRATQELKSRGVLNGVKRKKVTYSTEELYGAKGQYKAGIVPEIRISYNRGRRILGKASSPQEIAQVVRKLFKKGSIETREHFFVIYLNNQNNIIGYHLHSSGGLTSTIVDNRIVFAIALKTLSTKIILAHNHPSGNLKASTADIKKTNEISKIGKFHDIEVLDHVIVTKDGYLSMMEEGLI